MSAKHPVTSFRWYLIGIMFELEHFCAKTKGEWFKMCYFDIELCEYHENFDWITETTLFLVVWRHVNQSEN